MRHKYCGYPVVELEDENGRLYCPLCNESIDIDDDEVFEDYHVL